MNKPGILEKWTDIFRRFGGKGTYPHELSFILDSPLRRLLLSPERLADRLHLAEDFWVLEVGAGPGYFSVEVARRLPAGRLILLDIQQEMLLKARRKIAKARLTNVDFVQANATCLPFGRGIVDVIFLVTVMGEVADPATCLCDSFRVLRSGGLLSITEQQGDPDALSLATVRSFAEKQGFELLEIHSKGKNFTANFRKSFN